MKYLLDVDGTLTDSRKPIDTEFAIWFARFCARNDVYLVTGSDRPKTVEQVGIHIYHLCKRAYQCNGNDVWYGNINLRTIQFPDDPALDEALNDYLANSDFPIRTGNHIEKRPGMTNFSILGRNATPEDRWGYVMWDKEYDERDVIAHNLSIIFPKYNFQVAGDTGIDITVKGHGKEQVLTDFKESDRILFIGDKCAEGGNDHGIAQAVSALSDNKNSFAYGTGKFYNVEGWKDTWEILRISESE